MNYSQSYGYVHLAHISLIIGPQKIVNHSVVAVSEKKAKFVIIGCGRATNAGYGPYNDRKEIAYSTG